MFALIAAFALSGTSLAADKDGISTAQGDFLRVPMTRRTHAAEPGLSRRASSLDLKLHNHYYFIDFELGTPPQSLSLLLDTNSADTFVLDPSACHGIVRNCSNTFISAPDQCLSDLVCLPGSSFYTNDSATFRSNDSYFYTKNYASQYSDPIRGYWAQDILHFGDHDIPNFNFAVANESEPTYNAVAGLGLMTAENSFERGDISTPYANLPQQLKNQGIIQSTAYSIWLNRLGTDTGFVLFGGIDRAKLASELYTMPLVRRTKGVLSDVAVEMTGLSIYDANGNEQPFLSCSDIAILDPASMFTVLPFSYYEPFYRMINATAHGEEIDQKQFYEAGLVPCNRLSSKDGGIGIQLGGVDITVGFSDLFVKVSPTDDKGTEYCVPGFVSGRTAIIGENILRNLYVVYDLENLEVGIGLAQTNASAASNSSIEILSTGIPGTRANKHLKSTLKKPGGYGVTSITLVSSAPPPKALVVSVSGLWKVPPSVTQKVMIGAKVTGSASAMRASPLLATFATLASVIVALLC